MTKNYEIYNSILFHLIIKFSGRKLKRKFKFNIKLLIFVSLDTIIY